MKASNFFLVLVRVILGTIFVVSGFQKLWAPAVNFAAAVEKFEIIHGSAATLLSQTLPWFEFIGGVFLILGLHIRLVLPMLWVMNTVFIGILGSSIFRKLSIQECGCFGESMSLPLPVMIGIDTVTWIFFLIYFLVSRRTRILSLDAFFEKSESPNG